MAFFKPQRLEWEDIEGGVGENTIDEIWNFANDYGYGEHTFDNDESLNNELSDFAEKWSILMNYTADEKQVMAALSLIHGAFYTSTSGDKILDALLKSGTKKDVVKIAFKVAAIYCRYIELQNRIKNAEEE